MIQSFHVLIFFDSLSIADFAGTGKSYLLKYLIQEMKSKYGELAVAVTAPTGIAAINVGGTTIHSFAGIGLGKNSSTTCIFMGI